VARAVPWAAGLARRGTPRARLEVEVLPGSAPAAVPGGGD
jgi:hypothetical protein